VATSLLGKRRATESRKVYSSVGAAVQARLKTVEMHPGDQSLSAEGAELIVRRGLQEQEGGGFCFSHDVGILPTQAVYVDEEAVRSYFNAISAAKVPTLLLTAEQGWPFPKEAMAARMALLEGLESHSMDDCSHHLHVDPGSAEAVAEHVQRFLNDEPHVVVV
jgi:pimeloyl-ACP methyl ester carboxylesterase